VSIDRITERRDIGRHFAVRVSVSTHEQRHGIPLPRYGLVR
jgi:hypothetical protein